MGRHLTAPRLPNLIGLFPRNIGTSGSAFASYFAINDPGIKYIQRIPKIKWMNHLVQDHQHHGEYSINGDVTKNNRADGRGVTANGPSNRNTSTVTLTVSLKNNDWNNIETGTNVNLSNYEFTNRFEPKCIEVIPFIRMI